MVHYFYLTYPQSTIWLISLSKMEQTEYHILGKLRKEQAIYC